jgi:ssDNA-binding Zn-finger/Zn-ribbon topoisomerase 1
LAFKNTRNAKNSLVPNYCEIPDCEFTALITKHRIKPGRKGGKYIAGNVIGLCPNCHVLAEQGYFSQYELFQIVQKRLWEENQQLSGELDGCFTTA